MAIMTVSAPHAFGRVAIEERLIWPDRAARWLGPALHDQVLVKGIGVRNGNTGRLIIRSATRPRSERLN